jgi:hypothetical protein
VTPWTPGQPVYTHADGEVAEGVVERVYLDGTCRAFGVRWRRPEPSIPNGCTSGTRRWGGGRGLLWADRSEAAEWVQARRELTASYRPELGDIFRLRRARDAVVALLYRMDVEQVEALAARLAVELG